MGWWLSEEQLVSEILDAASAIGYMLNSRDPGLRANGQFKHQELHGMLRELLFSFGREMLCPLCGWLPY